MTQSDAQAERPAVSQMLTRRLQALFSSENYKPPLLPAVALELMAMAHNLEVELEDIVRLLENDPVLAGRVLKRVQTPFYAGQNKIKSLRQAVIRLGLTTLRDIVADVAMGMRVFIAKDYSESMARLRLHSTLTAHVARTICLHTKVESGYAFLCGLFHDIGIAGCLLALADVPRETKRLELDSLWPTINALHEEASGVLCRFWKLPQEIIVVVENHHRVMDTDGVSPLAATVCLAEYLAQSAGAFVQLPPSGTPDEATPTRAIVDDVAPEHVWRARKVLRLGDSAFEALRAEASGLFAAVASQAAD